MGNYRFRLSDMMPNAWFYKLKDMSKTRNHNTVNKKQPSPTKTSQKPHFSQPRKSYYYTTESIRVGKLYNSPKNPKYADTRFPDPPRKSSSKKRTKRKTVYKPSPRQISPSIYNYHDSVRHKVEQFQDYFECSTVSSSDMDFLKSPVSEFDSETVDAPASINGLASWSSSCSCTLNSSGTDIIIDMDEKLCTVEIEESDEFDMISESEPKLPPILTKFNTLKPFPEKPPSQIEHSSIFEEPETRCTEKQTHPTPTSRKSISRSAGVKLRANSPRLASMKVQVSNGRKSLSKRSKLPPQQQKKKLYTEGVAIVKASFDPEKDFMESMMEMIVENNIRESKDLENLLACYFSLNADEYHDLIIKAFEQIWYNMPELQ